MPKVTSPGAEWDSANTWVPVMNIKILTSDLVPDSGCSVLDLARRPVGQGTCPLSHTISSKRFLGLSVVCMHVGHGVCVYM